MLNQDTKVYIEDYISNKILNLTSPGEPIRDAFNSYILYSNSVEGLANYIEKWIDPNDQKRMFAAARKYISRRNVARANSGHRETNIKLTPKIKDSLQSIAQDFGSSMTEALAMLVLHAKTMSAEQRFELRRTFKSKIK